MKCPGLLYASNQPQIIAVIAGLSFHKSLSVWLPDKHVTSAASITSFEARDSEANKQDRGKPAI